jgi:toxin ParE1/3/4
VKVRFTIDALLHIGSIHAYINERNPVAANRVIKRIRAAAERLGQSPRMGHVGTAPGTREWTVVGLPYVIVHDLDEHNDEVVILGIYHGAQLRPGQAGPASESE